MDFFFVNPREFLFFTVGHQIKPLGCISVKLKRNLPAFAKPPNDHASVG
jgi:hypothetical protein